MSYYILPKVNSTVIINPTDNINLIDSFHPHISHSLFKYYTENTQVLQNVCDNLLIHQYNYEEVLKYVHALHYIFSTVQGSQLSVSKLKYKVNTFYNFLEVCTILHIFDCYKSQSIVTLHITNSGNDTIECLEIMRENESDENICYDELNNNTIQSIGHRKFDFMFFENDTHNDINPANLNVYIISLIQILITILHNQNTHGTSIIKISHIFYKPIIDIIYIFSALFEKTCFFKPKTCNKITFDKYLICTKFQSESSSHVSNYNNLTLFLRNLITNNTNVESILNYEIPYCFMVKLNDINIIFGQQQLEKLDLLINTLKSKNKEDKIELINKTNIQKSIAWCEKFKIPHNKFPDKINLFLPLVKESHKSI